MTEVPDSPLPATKAPPTKAAYAVMALMGLNILLGLGTAAAGHWLLESDGIAVAGAALATIAAILMLSYLIWGAKR